MMKPKAYSYIRFSTSEQKKGDSLRRQLEASQEYCKRKGLILDESLTLHDLGLSAYKGLHRTKGALGEFLNLIESGKITQGSVFIVENLDRLSRQEVLTALNQFTGIINAGIKLVTLQDGMEYSKESITENWTQLIISITYMARANEESKVKSQRGSSTWRNKRNKIAERILTKKCPLWLKPNDDLTGFEVIEERATVIKLIFDMKLSGKGNGTIVRELNQSDLWKPQGRKTKMPSWRESYIDKIIRNSQVIGEYQPHKLKDGKRVPIGEPLQQYYPAVVDKEVFFRMQAIIKDNLDKGLGKGYGGGRSAKMKNLFALLAVCFQCGSPMRHIDKGKPPKGGRYFACDNRMRNLGCQSPHMRYDIIERSILLYCKGLDVSDILPDGKETATERTLLIREMEGINAELLDISNKMENILETASLARNEVFRKAVEHQYSVLNIRKEKLEKQQQEKQAIITALDNNGKEAGEQLQNVQELIDKMEAVTDKERFDIRINLRHKLRKLINFIKISTERKAILLVFPNKLTRVINLHEDALVKIWDRTKPPMGKKASSF